MSATTEDILYQYMFRPDKEQHLTTVQKTTCEQCESVYHLWLENPMISDTEMVAMLQEREGCTKNHAIDVVKVTKMALGDVKKSSKSAILLKVNYLLESAFAATNAGDFKKAENYRRIAEAYIKAYRTDVDEGEVANIASIMRIDKVTIVNNPLAAGVPYDPNNRKKADELMAKYGIKHLPDIEDVTPLSMDQVDIELPFTEFEEED